MTALPEVLEKLEPCPMCGGEAHLERQGHVACKTGWPCVHTAYFNSGTPEEQNAAAITAWNKRPALLRDAGDAARYRWLRNQANYANRIAPQVCVVDCMKPYEFRMLTGDDVDTAVDAAMHAPGGATTD